MTATACVTVSIELQPHGVKLKRHRSYAPVKVSTDNRWLGLFQCSTSCTYIVMYVMFTLMFTIAVLTANVDGTRAAFNQQWEEAINKELKIFDIWWQRLELRHDEMRQ